MTAPVQRSKTFTGCWTCRSRKIKCTLERPSCKKCENANLQCEGYSIRLRWNPGGKEEDAFFQRRNVEFVQYPSDMVYETYYDMDVSLSKLHSPDLVGNETKSLGPFGVFDGIRKRKSNQPMSNTKRKRKKPLKRKRNSTSNDSDIESDDNAVTETNGNKAIESNTNNTVNNNTTTTTNNTNNNTYNYNNEDSLDDLLFNNFEQNINLFEDNYEELRDELSTLLASDSNFAPFSEFWDNGLDTQLIPQDQQNQNQIQNQNQNQNQIQPVQHILQNDQPYSTNNEQLQNIHSQQPPSHQSQPQSQPQPQSQQPHFPSSLFSSTTVGPIQHYLSSDQSFALPTNSLYFTAQARYLLHHYTKEVTRIMMVMNSDKNPWVTIYLPRAIAGIGDLTSKGSTPSARNALLHALLSISAYHMASKHLENSIQKEHYAALGLQLKGEAYRWLSECLTKELASQKYKDVLTAVLSMQSIDAISGVMTDCQVHLSACKSIVNMRCRIRPKVSNKAATLHRIAGFLGIMQSSTALDSGTMNLDSKMFNDQWLNVRLEDLESSPNESSRNSPALLNLDYMHEESEFKEYWTRYQDKQKSTLSDDFYKKEFVTTHCLYGVPDSLLLLFNRVCKVAQQAVYYNNKSEPFSHGLSKDCAEVEALLAQWQTRYDINNKQNYFKGESRDAVNHHAFAFHQSLIIYYFRLVRNLSPEVLQGNISAVLDHLEKIQKINRGKKITVCVPLMFPGFMAACETTKHQSHLRSRFQTWLDQQTVEGVGTYISARRVINEVWRRRDSNLERSDWWKVLKDWKMNLMLS